jgi:hypothetical protein
MTRSDGVAVSGRHQGGDIRMSFIVMRYVVVMTPALPAALSPPFPHFYRVYGKSAGEEGAWSTGECPLELGLGCYTALARG